MADLRPFRGFRYADDDLAAVVTPPYDVISPQQQAQYYERSEHNIIRLELGRDEPGDDTLDNRYTRAAATFARWRLEGVLQQDAAPALYLYQQQFAANGQQFTRTSIVGRVRLEPWEAGVILPHERTMPKPKDDRLRLLRACTANLSPIMALYDDPKKAVNKLLAKTLKTAPLARCTDDAGEQHALWAITNPATIDKIAAFFAPEKLYIADGHHRYETALAFRDYVAELHRGLAPDDAANFVMMALVATNDPGLVVLPTHRLLRGIADATLAALPEKLAQYWTVEDLAESDPAQIVARLGEAGAAERAAVVATRDRRWLLRLAQGGVERLRESGESEAWQRLDVAAAQEAIIDAALGISRDAVSTYEGISYTRDPAQALAAVADGSAQVAILLNPTRPEQVRDVAAAGGRMPQKSTYFYPKLITGMVINPVW